ncbi:MAG: polysaccharide biosynthesis tyrosine autokinase [Rhodoglobus sp.]
MELSGYLRILRAHWIAIVLFTLVGGASAFGWALIQPKVYAANASAIITTGVSGDLGSALVGDNYAKSRVKSYLNVAESRSVAQFAIDKLSLSATPEELIARISVTNPNDTAVLEVTAEGPTPEESRDLAETWIAGMIAQVTTLENAGAATTTPAPTDGTATPVTPPTESIVKLQTLDSAVLPTTPSSPNTRLAIAIGLLLGLIVGVAYGFIRNVLDRRIRSTDTIEKEFGLAVVGTIPFDRNFSDTNRLVEHASDLAYGSRTSDDDAVAEAMRELRTNLQFMDIDNPPRVIVVTSSLPGEGKSTLTANLAVTIAASGQRVIVVDGDLRRPTVAKAFNLLPGVGLTDVLIGRAEVQQVLQPWGETGKLLVMGAGALPPNPSELLGSNAMHALLLELSKQAIVLVDAPPLIPVTDAAILTARSDGALIVASAGKTTVDALDKSLQNLARVNGHPLGVILNRVPRRGAGGGYYGYQYKGEYSARDDAPKLSPDGVEHHAGRRTTDARGTAHELPVDLSEQQFSFEDLMKGGAGAEVNR